MAAVKLKDGVVFDGESLANTAYGYLPGYAVPLFVRVAREMEYTSTFNKKVDLRTQGYAPDVTTRSTYSRAATRASSSTTTSSSKR
jgi:fatty-acyl-CoA synthase